MQSLLRSNRIVLALCFNGIVLLLILVALLARDGRGFGPAAAFGQLPPTAGNAGGVIVMPGQLSSNHWGCYVMDSQNQTLSVYQYDPGETVLRLTAARDIQYDRKLKFYNTAPPPTEIRKWLERAEEPSRAAPTTDRSPEANPQ